MSWLHNTSTQRDGLRLTKLTYHRQSTELRLLSMNTTLYVSTTMLHQRTEIIFSSSGFPISVRLARKIPRGDNCPRPHSHVPPTQSLRHKGAFDCWLRLATYYHSCCAVAPTKLRLPLVEEGSKEGYRTLFSSNENRLM